MDNPGIIFLLVSIFFLILSLVGGGVEIKEIKIPKIGMWARMVCAAVSVVFLFLGVVLLGYQAYRGMREVLVNPTATPSISQPAPVSENQAQPAASGKSSNLAPIQDWTPQLPAEQGISLEVERALSNLILKADKAEIEAVYYQDSSYLEYYYQGDALKQLQDYIDSLRESGYIVVEELDTENSYYTGVRRVGNSNIYAVDQCEYWKESYYDSQTNEKVKETNWTLNPQTINIELINGQPYITSISFYNGLAFCTN